MMRRFFMFFCVLSVLIGVSAEISASPQVPPVPASHVLNISGINFFPPTSEGEYNLSAYSVYARQGDYPSEEAQSLWAQVSLPEGAKVTQMSVVFCQEDPGVGGWMPGASSVTMSQYSTLDDTNYENISEATWTGTTDPAKFGCHVATSSVPKGEGFVDNSNNLYIVKALLSSGVAVHNVQIVYTKK